MSREQRRRAQLKRTIQRAAQGKQVTLKRTDQTFDPTTADASESVSSSLTVAATPPQDFTLARIDQTLIQADDTVVEIAALDVDLGTPSGPKASDVVEIDGRDWNIIQIGTRYTGAQIGSYVLHLGNRA